MPLKPSMGIKAYIKDFQKSDAPQFKGHSKEKRRDQAIAAYLDAKDKLKEEKGRGPTGIAYSLPKGHPDAENPATRKKYPERQTPEYKKKFFNKDKSSPSSFGMNKESINFIGAPGLRGGSGPYGTKRTRKSKLRDIDDTASERMLKGVHGEKKTKKIMQARRLRTKAGLTHHGSTAAALKHHEKTGQAFKDAIVPPKRGMLTKIKDKILNKAHPLFRDMEESTKRVTQVSLDQAKRDLKMKKIQKKMKSLDEISVSLRNKYYDAAKKSHDTAANSAFAASLRKEPYDKEMDTMRKRKKGIKTAKDQAIKNIRGELYKKKTEAMDPMMLGKMQAQAAATQRMNQKKRDEEEKKAMAKKAAGDIKKVKEGAFYGRDDLVKAFKDDDKKRGMVRVRKQDGNMTHTVTVKRNSADHKKYEKKGYKMDPYFNEMTMGQGIMVKKVPAGDPAPQGYKLKKLAKMHGGKFDVYHKETEKVRDAKAGRTMYSDTTTEKLDHQDKPLVKKVVGMLKKASKAHAGQAKSLSKAMADEAYIKSDKVYPHPQSNLTKMQRRALTALDKRAKKPVTLPGMDMLKKKEKEPTKVGRQSQIVRYEARGVPRTYAKTFSKMNLKKARELMSPAKHRQDGIDRIAKGMGISKARAAKHHDEVMKSYGFRPESVNEKFSIKLPPVRGGKKILNVSMGRAIKMLKDFGATKSDMRNVLSGKGGRFQNAGGEMFLVQRESVNEVSMKTLGNYIKKRTADIASAGSLMTGDYGIGPAEKKAKRMKGVRDYSRFDRGVKKAVDKMTGKAKVPATNEQRDRGEFSGDISFMGHDKLKHHYKTGERNKVFSKRQINKEFERRRDAAARRKAIFGKDTTPSGKPGPSYESVTWYMPTSKEVTILRNMMKRPIALGENAVNAIDNIPIGSDTLHKIFVAEAKKDPNTDARAMIEKWLNNRLSHGDEEAEWLGIRLGILEGYEADVLKHLRKKGHEDPYFKGGHLMVSPNDHKSVVKTLKKKFGGMSPRGGSMMPSIKMDK